MPVTGPVLENHARASCLSTAPTVSAEAAVPGEETVCGPALPAAITKSVPYWSESALTSCAIGSLPSAGAEGSPRLMLTTLAPEVAAHSMPAITHESCPKPVSSSTLPTSRCAPGATPL